MQQPHQIKVASKFKPADIYSVVEAQQRRLTKAQRTKYFEMKEKYLPKFKENMDSIKDLYKFEIIDCCMLLGEGDSLKVGKLIFSLVATQRDTGNAFKVDFIKSIATTSNITNKNLNGCFYNSPTYKKALPKCANNPLTKPSKTIQKIQHLSALECFEKLLRNIETGSSITNEINQYYFGRVLDELKLRKALKEVHKTTSPVPLDFFFVQDVIREILAEQVHLPH